MAKLQHSRCRGKAAETIAKELIDESSPKFAMALFPSSVDADDLEYIRKVVEIVKARHHASNDELAVLCFVNWASPSLFSAPNMRSVANVLGSFNI
eukprot:6459153-Amphidinium_carterae.1